MPDFPVRLVSLPKQIDLKKVFKIKHLCSAIITWEPYINKKGVTQCHRCQKFGHGTKNCHLEPSCVKCGEVHLTEVCTKTKDTPPKCANCEGKHPASYSQCPKVIQHLNKNNLIKNRAKIQRQPQQPKIDFSTRSFPALKTRTKTYASTWPTENENYTDNVEQIQKLFAGVEKTHKLCNVEKLLKRLEMLNKALATCETEGEQLLAILNATK